MPRIVEFRNAQDEREERRDMVKDVLLKRTGQRLSKQDYFLREILLWGLHKDEYVPCKSLSDFRQHLIPIYQILGSKKLNMRM